MILPDRLVRAFISRLTFYRLSSMLAGLA